MSQATFVVDRTAVRKNIRTIKEHLSPETKLLAVVKGSCYGLGLGLLDIYEEEGVDFYGVVMPQEALELREHGITKPILIFGYVFPEDYEEMVRNDVRIGIERYEDAEALSALAAKLGRDIPIHIRIDSGMGRLGYLPTEENADEIARIFKLPGLIPEGIMTHFAIADERKKNYTEVQLARFLKMIAYLHARGVDFEIRHAGNSGAALMWPDAHLDMVRVGSAIFGIYPSESMERDPEIAIEPVSSLRSRLASVKRIPADESIGYGRTYFTDHETLVGVVPVGYVDGAYRTLANHGEVLVHGRRCPIVGKICMDQMMIVLDAVPDAAIGDAVVLFGKQGDAEITIDEHARMTGEMTTPSGIINRMGNRNKILYVGE